MALKIPVPARFPASAAAVRVCHASSGPIVGADGATSALFVHRFVDGDDTVSVDELFLIAVVNGPSNLTLADFGLFR